MIVRALLVWLLIFGLEVLHGTARTLWLVPLVGDLRSRQIGVPVGSLLILLVAWLTIRWIGPRTSRQRVAIGVGWLFGIRRGSFPCVSGSPHPIWLSVSSATIRR